MAGEGKFEVEIIYCVPWSHHGMAAWMANEFFAEAGSDIAIRITPGVGGIIQVFADWEKIYDKNGEETLKVWPGALNINMPKMIFKKENINQLMIVKSIQKIKKNRYKMYAATTVDDIVSISGEALIVVLWFLNYHYILKLSSI